MGKFFNGWKKKAGLASLVLALTITGAWMRSLATEDVFRLSIGRSDQYIESERGGIGWRVDVHQAYRPSFKSPFDWRSYAIDGPPPPPPATKTLLLGCGLVISGDSYQLLPVPYWLIVILLTLFSVILILTKPHPANQTNIAELTQVVVASAAAKAYHGNEWSRRIGLVTSAIALGALGVWGSGHSALIGYCTGKYRVHWIATSNEGFVWRCIQVPEDSFILVGSEIWYTAPFFDGFAHFTEESRIQFWGFQIVAGVDQVHKFPAQVKIIPHWAIAIPLTLLSAYLLLVKPRVAKPKIVGENLKLD